MKRYLNIPIKEVLKKYPQLAPTLAKYDINCYKCSGNCLLKSIFEEHNLSMKEEMDLKSKMAKIITNETLLCPNKRR
jgi:predicted metal-binding transcription factor (methanogenesis marker protein 9)